MIPCQLQSRAPCTHVEQRATLAQFEFAFVFRHSACHVENSLRRFADAGQTTDTHTRGETHVRVSGRRGRRAEVGSETPNTLRAITTLLKKSGQALLSFDVVPSDMIWFRRSP